MHFESQVITAGCLIDRWSLSGNIFITNINHSTVNLLANHQEPACVTVDELLTLLPKVIHVRVFFLQQILPL